MRAVAQHLRHIAACDGWAVGVSAHSELRGFIFRGVVVARGESLVWISGPLPATFPTAMSSKRARLLVALRIAAALVAACSATTEFHREVTGLPGWDGPLPSRTFSGFGFAGRPPSGAPGQMLMHYVFIESEGRPSEDPVLVWYNGGPGATSLFGLLVEFGPLLLNADSIAADGENQPRLIRNEYSWTRLASLLIVNSPPPVGFSYCEPDGPSGDGRCAATPLVQACLPPCRHAALLSIPSLVTTQPHRRAGCEWFRSGGRKPRPRDDETPAPADRQAVAALRLVWFRSIDEMLVLLLPLIFVFASRGGAPKPCSEWL